MWEDVLTKKMAFRVDNMVLGDVSFNDALCWETAGDVRPKAHVWNRNGGFFLLYSENESPIVSGQFH